MKKLIFILVIVLCSCSAQNKNSSNTMANITAYQEAVEAIKFRDFALVADIIAGPDGNNTNPDPTESFLYLRGGEDGHFQVSMMGYAIDGKASNIKSKVRNNGDVEFSMVITSNLSSINSVTVNLTMKNGSNIASASVFLERLTYKLSYTMNGKIYPIEGLPLHIAPERLQTGNFMNPFSYN